MNQNLSQSEVLSIELEEELSNELEEETKNKLLVAIRNEWSSNNLEQQADQHCWFAELNDVSEQIENDNLTQSEALSYLELLQESANSREQVKSQGRY